jgi:phosphatidylserine/phosphatidylglycerophosphate/cardiolipin synthase-like enzyme
MADLTLNPLCLQLVERLAARSGHCTPLFAAWSGLSAATSVDARELTRLAGLSLTEEQGAYEILQELSLLGLLTLSGHRWLPKPEFYSELAKLVVAFSAIDHYKVVVHQDATEAQVILTSPASSNALETQLQASGWHTAEIEPTDRAFQSLVRLARESVVVMTPFLDARGADWLHELLGQVRAGVAIKLVLRSLEDATRLDYPAGYAQVRPWLAARGASVFNYSIPRDGGRGRETFHAKVILCDRASAYVGSTNLTAASRDYSMEMGVVLHGKAALQIGEILDAVMRASEAIEV